VRLTYKPLNNTFLGKEIKDRSYEVYLDVGLDSTTDILYKSAGDEGYPAVVVSGTPRLYKANGINTAFQYLFFNTTTNELTLKYLQLGVKQQQLQLAFLT
jgi:hypothetical protein